MLKAAHSRTLSRTLLKSTHRALSTRPVHIEVDVFEGEDTGVRILRMSRPEKLNPMTVEMGDAMAEAVSELRSLGPSDLRAVVVTGAGRAFSAGGDTRFLSDRMSESPTTNAQDMLGFYRRFLSIRTLPVPVIACINGPAIGAGLCFALATDVRYTHDAASLGLTFVGLGLHPGMGGTHTLAAVAGAQAANRMLLSGDVITGSEAQQLGLVVKSLPDADAAFDASLGFARRVASQSPLAVRATLATLRAQTNEGLDRALMREADAQAQSYASSDYAEGLAALVERRKPLFTGA